MDRLEERWRRRREEDGRYVYRLLVREAKGRLKSVNVDARKPFEH